MLRWLPFSTDAYAILNHVQGQPWKRVWIFEARSDNGCRKWHFLVWNWVWIWKCGRYTPTKNSKECLSTVDSFSERKWSSTAVCATWNLFEWSRVINRYEISLRLGIYMHADSKLKWRKIAIVRDTTDNWTLQLAALWTELLWSNIRGTTTSIFTSPINNTRIKSQDHALELKNYLSLRGN